ncbi:eukaryotic mitochondrial regulator protein-domain-containing protein [Bombardia bombarda]|uniref:Eukaryotic mitochondrial regulator protein-domain-containing protein n=1 Tax=Bombardia bombarda TaxID=252184 RepID=A0AA39WBI7_9PEZI|nr:eukaryotic mitochondrial regulator protein-domain-containing protein [Bombardia bombarda]
MPPRIRSSPGLLLNRAETSVLLHNAQPSPAAGRPWAAAATTSSSSSSSHYSPQCVSLLPQHHQQTSSFSTTASRDLSRNRTKFWAFLKKEGRDFKNAPGEPKYLGDLKGSKEKRHAPFPNNPTYKSEPVLSDVARETIWREIMKQGMPLKAVSAKYSVDMRRVAAVVRMKEIERQWEADHKPKALPYAKAITSMVPQHSLSEREQPFEPVNDVHVHSYTQQQLFWPASESREFTRKDAAEAFGEHILPPDEKMRIPELMQLEKDINAGVEKHEAYKSFLDATRESELQIANRERTRLMKEEANKTRVDSGRFEFRFERFNADNVGKNGRARKAVGWRYGVPFSDRRRAEVKIPTKME